LEKEAFCNNSIPGFYNKNFTPSGSGFSPLDVMFVSMPDVLGGCFRPPDESGGYRMIDGNILIVMMLDVFWLFFTPPRIIKGELSTPLTHAMPSIML
jgi:hypothetical protein